MRITFLRQYSVYRPGTTAERFHDGAAAELIRRGVARPAGEAPAPQPPQRPRGRPKAKRD